MLAHCIAERSFPELSLGDHGGSDFNGSILGYQLQLRLTLYKFCKMSVLYGVQHPVLF